MAHERDLVMDYLRGVVCIAMVIAHFPVQDKTDEMAVLLHHLVGSVTVVFFGISGINALAQAGRYSIRELLVVFAGLFIFGTSYSVIIHPTLYLRYVPEIFQIIAIGSVLVIVAQRFLGSRPWVYGLLGVLVVAVYLVVDLVFPQWTGDGVLFVHRDYVPHDQVPAGQPKIFPGFPMLPWLYIFFWGVFSYSLNQKQQAACIFVLGAALALGLQLNVLGVWFEKWHMTPAYLILSTLTFSVAVFCGRLLPATWLRKSDFILLFGKNSLAFLFMHGFGLLVAFITVRYVGQYLAWLAAIIVSYFALKLLQRWKGLTIFEAPQSWWIMGFLAVTLPLLPLWWKATIVPVVLLEVIIGILFSKHFPLLRGLIRQKHLQRESSLVAE